MAAKAYRDQQLGMLDRWRTYRAWYLNSGTLDGNNSSTPVNFIYEKVEKLTADLAQGKPEFLFEPNTINDISMTELLNVALPWAWDSHYMNSMYSRTIKASVMYGTWYWKVINDPQYGKTGAVQRAIQVPVWNGSGRSSTTRSMGRPGPSRGLSRSPSGTGSRVRTPRRSTTPPGSSRSR
jgi:hypothetical protein